MKGKFWEEYSEDAKKMIILLIVGVVLVVGFGLFLLKMIWIGPDEDADETANNTEVEEKVTVSNNVGTYLAVNNGQSLILKEYFSEIFRVLSSGTEKEVYSMLSKDYIEKYGYSSAAIYNKLKNKNMIGKAFECKEYSKAENPRFGNIYSLEISSVDGNVLDRLMIIEDKPRSYSLSFESYIGEKDLNIEVVREGVKLIINHVEEYRDRVYFDITVQNLNESDVILNYGSESNEAIYVELNDSKKVYNIISLFSSQEILLKPNGSMNGKVEFLINDLQSAFIKKMCLVNVYNAQSQTTSNFEYEIY